MRTRASSVTERMIIYAVAGAFLIVMVIGFFSIRSHYDSSLKTILEESAQINAEVAKLKNQIIIKESKKDELQNSFQERRDARDAEEKKYNDKKDELARHLDLLPPNSMKANILEVLTLKAMELNIQINSSGELTLPMDSYTMAMFTPASFAFDLQGEYENMKRYLWLLDHVIQVPDPNDRQKLWNVIVNVSNEVGKFEVIKYNEKNEPILNIAPQYNNYYGTGGATGAPGAAGATGATGAAGAANPNAAGGAVGATNMQNITAAGDKRILSREDQLRLKIQVVTYLRPDMQG